MMGDARRRRQRLFLRRRKPGGRFGERLAAATRDGESRMARGPGFLRDRERRVLVRIARDRDRRAAHRSRSRPRSSSCRLPTICRRTARSPTRSGCCSGITKRSSPRATAARSCGSTTTSAGAFARSSRRRADPKDRAVLHLTWDYPDRGSARRTRSPRACCARSTAGDRTARRSSAYTKFESRRLDRVRLLDLLRLLSRTRRIKPRAESPDPNRTGSRKNGAGRGPPIGALLYNRASADPAGQPWSERKKYVWWDDAKGEWTGFDTPDFVKNKASRLRSA